MSQVLYRKYRPRIFGEVEGQEHIVRTLRGAVLSGRVGHAYLFTGPRGTGKTTMARLFAKMLNCQKSISAERFPKESKPSLIEPCNRCYSCGEINENKFIDLIEIDAASNRGIDEARNIKESAQVVSSRGGKKIFIIDEVHMLTAPAFNALLKVLEEPPDHVVFILATTEPHKVIETILSRVQRFDFKKLNISSIENKLAKIAAKEKFSIDGESIRAIAAFAGGSLRDAENVLAKAVDYTGGRVTIKNASEILGITPESVNQEFLRQLARGNKDGGLRVISDLHESGVDLDNFSRQFLLFLRDKLVSSAEPASSGSDNAGPAFLADAIKTFIKARTDMKTSPIPQLPLELAVIEITSRPQI